MNVEPPFWQPSDPPPDPAIGFPGAAPFVVVASTLFCMTVIPAAFWFADNGLLPWADDLAWTTLRASQDSSADLDGSVTIERQLCFGTCPHYSLTLHATGQVDFEGRDYVCARGTHHARVDPADARELLHDLERAGYFELRWTFGDWASDHPTVNTRLELGGRARMIRHDRGDQGAPRHLNRMEDAIDEIAGTRRWLPVREGRDLWCETEDGTRRSLRETPPPQFATIPPG